MSNPIILSDEEEDDQKTPLPSLSKKPRTGSIPDHPIPTILLLDDTPQKPGPTSTSTPIFVPETPMSDLSIVKCTGGPSVPEIRVSDHDPNGGGGLICLESENDDSDMENWKDRNNDENNETMGGASHEASEGAGNDIYQARDYFEEENFSMEQMGNIGKQKRRAKANSDKKNSSTDEAVGKKRLTKEERIRLMEEKKLKKEQEKLEKAALKAQAAELKKMEKERQKWEKGKFALKSIVAEFDTKVVEQGSVGGHLLTRFADKGLTYRITSNPIKKSIVWTMRVPEHISQLSPEGTEIRYVLLIYEAEEFCNLVINESLLDHVSRVRSCYPSYTVCYLTNRLMAYINKREKEQYKNPENYDGGWRCPPIEEVVAKLTTHFVRVHHRQCNDEAEVAEHVVGLTCSLASCQFRKKLTRLSVNANGSLIPKDFIDKNLIKKSPWLKALVAIPKVQPRFAIAIWKKYPTMKSLLSVYMDPSKSVHEKEFLLEDLMTEGLLGGERRVGQICSKRVYRILMARSGSIKTDNVEDGADFF